MMKARIVSAEEAVAMISDGSTVAIGGTGPVLEPDKLLDALEQRFLREAHPRNLTIFSPMLPGDRAGVGGLNAVAHEGMLARIIGASFSASRHPKLLDMIRAEKCEGYVVGMGTMVQLLTSAAARKPGVWTTVGIGSFLDPRVEGGRMNERSRDATATVESVRGQEYLFYPTVRLDVAIIRGTTADENGYISFEEEPNLLGMAEIAAATKACGGKVLVQVKRIARANSLDPRLVRIPGALVDAIVVNPAQSQLSPAMSDPLHGWNPSLAGSMKADLKRVIPLKDVGARVMMRRALLELRPGDVINLGVGAATNLPRIALEEDILDKVVFTNEHGVFGGLMASALGGSFVPALNADAIMDSVFQFNFYESGGLDVTFLGVGQIDAEGNVNVSKFSGEWNGAGGFNSIIERTPRLVFCGSLTAGGLQLAIDGGKLKIVREGKHNKFVQRVEQITLNAPRARAQGQEVLYITERAVFRLDEVGPLLTEIAPGIDPAKHIQPFLAFPLRQSKDLKVMDPRIFAEAPMNLKANFAMEH
jgi:propionate CoA-transferase